MQFLRRIQIVVLLSRSVVPTISLKNSKQWLLSWMHFFARSPLAAIRMCIQFRLYTFSLWFSCVLMHLHVCFLTHCWSSNNAPANGFLCSHLAGPFSWLKQKKLFAAHWETYWATCSTNATINAASAGRQHETQLCNMCARLHVRNLCHADDFFLPAVLSACDVYVNSPTV